MLRLSNAIGTGGESPSNDSEQTDQKLSPTFYSPLDATGNYAYSPDRPGKMSEDYELRLESHDGMDQLNQFFCCSNK